MGVADRQRRRRRVAADGEEAAERAPEDNDTAAVGYGRPPQHTSNSKPGCSGNPRGRPKKTRKTYEL